MRSPVSLAAFLLLGLLARRSTAQIPISFMINDPNPEAEGRFGRDVHIVDLDADGYGDLVIGAEGKTVNNHAKAGKVYIKAGLVTPTSSMYAITEPYLGSGTGPRANDKSGIGSSVATSTGTAMWTWQCQPLAWRSTTFSV